MTSGGNRNPAKAERGGIDGRERSAILMTESHRTRRCTVNAPEPAARLGSGVWLESAGVSSGSVCPHDAPVTENHVVEEGPTKMIGARHGRGNVTVALISESPVAVAGKGAVATFVVVGLPATVVRQLTIA
jgi:hypothetical protein